MKLGSGSWQGMQFHMKLDKDFSPKATDGISKSQTPLHSKIMHKW